MLDGFVSFPPEFAARYREKGYWRDQSLAQEFATVFQRFAPRTALIDSGGGPSGDGERRWTYAELDAASDNLALNLLTANRFVTGEIIVIDGGFTAST